MCDYIVNINCSHEMYCMYVSVCYSVVCYHAFSVNQHSLAEQNMHKG